MTTLFLLVTGGGGGCQSLNELGVASVTKKWSGQNRTSRTACYGPDYIGTINLQTQRNSGSARSRAQEVNISADLMQPGVYLCKLLCLSYPSSPLLASDLE